MKILLHNYNLGKIEFEVQPEDTILSLKQKIESEYKHNSNNIRIMKQGTELLNSQSFYRYNIKNNDILYLNLKTR